MTKKEPAADPLTGEERSAVDQLVALRAQQKTVEGWLARLDDERGQVSSAVYERVHGDYTRRLAGFADETRPIEEAVRAAAGRLAALVGERTVAGREAKLEVEELELRGRLGELGEKDLSVRLPQARETLAALEAELAGLEGEHNRLCQLAGAPPPPSPAQARPPAAPAPLFAKPRTEAAGEHPAAPPPSPPPPSLAPRRPLTQPPPLPATPRADKAGEHSVSPPSSPPPPLQEASTGRPPAVAHAAPPRPPLPATEPAATPATTPATTASGKPADTSPSSAKTLLSLKESTTRDEVPEAEASPPAAGGEPTRTALAADETVAIAAERPITGATRIFLNALLVSPEPVDGRSEFPVEPLTTIGRTALNNIRLAHSAVSGRHAEIRFKPEGYCLRDLGSSNGTFVNGERIEEKVLAHGDRILIATYTLEFRLP